MLEQWPVAPGVLLLLLDNKKIIHRNPVLGTLDFTGSYSHIAQGSLRFCLEHSLEGYENLFEENESRNCPILKFKKKV